MREPDYLGNRELLKKHIIGFFSSRTTAPMSVLPTLDWAHEVARNPDVAIMSGFQSPMEREVLDILLAGKCGIIYVLNRSIYRRIPEKFVPLVSQNRILFLSLVPPSCTRPSKEQAAIRNRFIADVANELFFASVTPSSSLYSLLDLDKPIRQL